MLCVRREVLSATKNLSLIYIGTLTVADLILHNMLQLPTVPFAYIQPKRDSVQLFYYNSVMTTYGLPNIDADTYYELSKASVVALNTAPNFVIYFIESTLTAILIKVRTIQLMPRVTQALLQTLAAWG